ALGGKGSVGTLYWAGYFNTSIFADPTEELIGIIYLQTHDDTSFLIPNEFKSLVFHSLIN
ncbi:serine hydrolase, partial [Flavobacteriaceae bacterium]|nr:serine hydrolase [Flavobacteriaceae bacterium]